MSSWTADIRQREAAARREERETQKKYRDLERRIAARDKLSAWEQAQLEVEAHESALEVLLSVHKQQSTPIDWRNFASAIPPRRPLKVGRHEFNALLEYSLVRDKAESGSAEIEAARTRDEREHQEALAEYEIPAAQSAGRSAAPPPRWPRRPVETESPAATGQARAILRHRWLSPSSSSHPSPGRAWRRGAHNGIPRKREVPEDAFFIALVTG